MKIISACLCGIHCRYNGQKIKQPEFVDLLKNKQVIPVCPEQLGGLATPRPPCEIKNGDGLKVLQGGASVVNIDGVNLTQQFILGAKEVLAIAQNLGVDGAILKSRSPSCGIGEIYDGNFQGRLTVGDGVTAALLKLSGFKVISDEEFIKSKRRP
jgi:uncharacterized protein YbbK (DUF523 family)